MKNRNQSGKNITGTTRRDFVKLAGKSTILAGFGSFAFPSAGNDNPDSNKEEKIKDTVWLAGRTSTIAWSGDLIITGATLSGVALAILAARTGKKVLLVENGPVLGTEVSAQWNGSIPDGWFSDELASICKPHGGYRDNWFDPFISTLAFDRLAESANVSTLVCVTAIRPVPGEDKLLKGLEIAGKSGRQLVIAQRIVDASHELALMHQVLGLRVPQPIMVSHNLYLHGIKSDGLAKKIKVPEALGVTDNEVEIIGAMWPEESILGFKKLPVAENTGKIPESAEIYHTGIAIMQHLRKENPAFANVLLVDIAPECKYDYSNDPLPSFNSLKDTGLFAVPRSLNAISDRKSAENFLGKVINSSPKRRMNVSQYLKEKGKNPFATHELSAAAERNFPSAFLPDAPAYWHEPSDIIVAGCGTGGALAAIAAAKQGAGVTVLESIGFPGGTGIRSKVHGYYHGIEAGMQKSIDQQIDRMKSITGSASGYHPVAKAEALLMEMERAGVKYGVPGRLFGVIKNGNAVTAAIIASKDGYHVYPCRVAIDSTGDGDLAAAAGARYSVGRESDGFPFFFGYLPSTVIRGDSGWIVRGANNMLGCADATDTLDYSRGYFEGRAALWRQGPFTPEKHFCTLATLLGMRQSRTIHGPLLLSAEDFSEGKSWPDKVCSMSSNFDRAGFFALESEWMQRWIIMFGLWPQLWTGEIPYRCLYPEGVEGVLLGCRAFSVEHDVQSLARMQRDMQQLGEICGLAAALAVKSGKMPSEIEVPILQKMLLERGILPQNPPEQVLDLPAKELFNKLGGEQNGIAMWRLSGMGKENYPDWDLFSRTEKDTRKLFCGAVAVALNGSGNMPSLLKGVLESAVDERWEGPLLGTRSSPLCIVAGLALAYAKVEGTTERLSKLLDESAKYPFIKSVDVALLYNGLKISGEKEAVEPIRKHLSTLKSAKTTDEFQLQFAGVWVLQSLGCFDESYRLEAHCNSSNFLIKKAGIRLSKMAGKS